MIRHLKIVRISGLIFSCNEPSTLHRIIICNRKKRLLLAIKHFFVLLLVFLSQWVKAQVPVADFSGTPVAGCAPLVVQFSDKSSGDPKSWSWDFGNGQLANIQHPVVVFTVPGVYTVTLVVKNAAGTHGVTKTNYIRVNPSPQADFSANLVTGCVPVNVQFSDLSTEPGGSILS